MAQTGLGRAFNVTPAADSKWINLKAAGGASFCCYLTGAAGDTYTVLQAQDAASTGSKALTAVTDYWTNTGDGSDAWTHRTQAAANTVVTAAAAAQNAMVFEVLGTALDDGFSFVKVTSTGAGAVTALTTDLAVKRGPSNLPAMGV